ncbi:hypothetical protein JQ557_28820 [Bradyrhizobium sp. U87765 SZCCT0131]|uniref:hypothetical protein n=1 Tax=unclassified Bradyrhizobium TaxID=2631580 RepID=UPI001BABB147|nr:MULTISPECIES: hypothetical protein [unclassified Bradyrhizobium]MBR1222036.1 hypothetical protein [Bradyrhizobium sp. U87765 SZCCT0131]MBR1263766.1 hypothetical protein [Bradyrhizobium sp. U87765 SZCCT0134]MBR1302664.1 hypothetical protein [Bradyrhizobium sp. U87765 SZCCT0110]MBR1320016.1 hypothetical protein [Bradyrhizobium sp. U87765 SZCCT0109]MBR1348871.1 hypothetical protein [Bradyrhizobium sp. U87765 SZCCT0048]
MADRSRMIGRYAVVAMLSVAWATGAAVTGVAAQTAGLQQVPSVPPPVVQAAPQPPGVPVTLAPEHPAGSGGFVDEIGKFFSDPPLGWPTLKSPQQTLDDINTRAKDATDSLTRFSKGKVVAGRVKCQLAANGAPDCKSAATRLCTDKGYKEGQSLDSDSAESCSASVLLSGKKEDLGQCRVENFVIRALCQ